MEQKHFSEFYRKHIVRVYRFIFYRVRGRKDLAEDLTQDIFFKALSAFPSYDPSISESAWIFTIARNHLLNYLQKDRPSVDLEALENVLFEHDDWNEILSLRYEEKRLWQAINQLPKKDAELIRLKYLEGWPYAELAQKLGRTSQALRVQAHRTLHTLKRILKQN